MADLHIDDFYKDVARIFTHLYASFPRKIILYVEDICGPDTPDEFGLPSPRFLSCFSTMIWLAEAGYINYDTHIRQEALDQVTLSQRGLTLLYSRCAIQSVSGSSATETLTDDPDNTGAHAYPNNIARLRYALKHGSSHMLEQLVQHLLHQPYSAKPAG